MVSRIIIRKSSLIPLIPFAALLAGCEPRGRVGHVTVTEEDWDFAPKTGRILNTDHFRIYTSVEDVELRQMLPVFMESAYLQYTDLLPPATDKHAPEKLTTYLLRSREEWDRFSRHFFAQRYSTYARISYGGYTEQDTAVLYYDRQRIYTLSVMAHEGLHQYLYSRLGPAIPAWLNEGLACYCEAFEMRDRQPVFTPQRNTFRLNSLREALTSGGGIPLRDILATDAGRILDQNQARPYYAQVWALIVYIRHGERGRYAQGLKNLLADMLSGQMVTHAGAARLATTHPADVSAGEAVFRAYITDDLDGFERGFRAFVTELASF